MAYWSANSVGLLKHRSICIYQLLCACFDMSYILTVAIDTCLLRFNLGKKYSIDSSCLTKLVHILSLLEKNLPTLMPVAVESSKTCLNVISPPTPFYPKAPRHIRRHQTFETHYIYFLEKSSFPNRINFCLYFYKFQKNWWRNTALEIKVKRTVWFTFVKSLFRMIFGAISQ